MSPRRASRARFDAISGFSCVWCFGGCGGKELDDRLGWRAASTVATLIALFGQQLVSEAFGLGVDEAVVLRGVLSEERDPLYVSEPGEVVHQGRDDTALPPVPFVLRLGQRLLGLEPPVVQGDGHGLLVGEDVALLALPLRHRVQDALLEVRAEPRLVLVVRAAYVAVLVVEVAGDEPADVEQRFWRLAGPLEHEPH